MARRSKSYTFLLLLPADVIPQYLCVSKTSHADDRDKVLVGVDQAICQLKFCSPNNLTIKNSAGHIVVYDSKSRASYTVAIKEANKISSERSLAGSAYPILLLSRKSVEGPEEVASAEGTLIASKQAWLFAEIAEDTDMSNAAVAKLVRWMRLAASGWDPEDETTHDEPEAITFLGFSTWTRAWWWPCCMSD